MDVTVTEDQINRWMAGGESGAGLYLLFPLFLDVLGEVLP